MKYSTKAYTLIIVILLQSVFVMILTHNLIISLMEDTVMSFHFSFPLVVIVNLLAICSLFIIFSILHFLKNERKSLMKLNNSKEVIDALQGQKHDFHNHLNLLAAMLQINKYDQALEYIFKVSEKVDGVFSTSNIQSIEIASTLCRKCTIAESKGITVELDINTSMEHLKMDPMDLCKIIFNLLDNAIYELEQSNEEEKILSIDIQDYEDMYILAIGNSFPILSPDLFNKIFQPRYSTKEGDGHGYGLSIVKQTVEKNKGRITVESYQGVGTIFTLFLPKKKVSMAHLSSVK